MSGSIYLDLMVSNTRRHTIEIRPLTRTLWAYEVTSPLAPKSQRGTISTTVQNPLALLREVLNDLFPTPSPSPSQPQSKTSHPT